MLGTVVVKNLLIFLNNPTMLLYPCKKPYFKSKKMVGLPYKAKKIGKGLTTAGNVMQYLSPIVGGIGSVMMGPVGGLIGAGLGGLGQVFKYFGNQESNSVPTPVEKKNQFFYNGL
jgi:hypothetical protein